MAKRKRGGVNVSQLVRDYKSQHKRAKPKAIAEALGAQGPPSRRSTLARSCLFGAGKRDASSSVPQPAAVTVWGSMWHSS